MKSTILPNILTQYNPWWTTGQLPQKFVWPQKRFFIDKLIAQIEKPYITLLTGLRRIGKTVLVYQTIEHLLKQGTPPENIFYISLEEMAANNLHEIIENYRNLALPKGRVFCLLDEIHYINEWSNQIKSYYDQQADIKFFVTGSSSHLLFKASTESLVGRVNILPLYPLNFREYLHLNKISIEPLPALQPLNFDEIFKQKIVMLGLKDRLQTEFQTFLKFGGIPEYLDKSMKADEWYQFLRQNYLALVLFKDILMNYEIRDSRSLFRMAQYFANTITTPQSLPSIGTALGIKKETVTKYVRYLEEAFLIAQAAFFSTSPAKSLRRNSKFYLTDIGLTQALYASYVSPTETEIAKIIENLIFQELRAFLSQQTGLEFPELHYWKDRHEVDFVLTLTAKPLPIEIKYTNHIQSNDFRGLIQFSRQFDCPAAVMVTKDIFEKRKVTADLTVYLIPALIFSLLLN